MILNLFGVLFAIAAIVLYSIDLALQSLWWLCNDDYQGYYDTTRSPAENVLMEKCYEGKELVLVSVTSPKSSSDQGKIEGFIYSTDSLKYYNIQLPLTEPYKMS